MEPLDSDFKDLIGGLTNFDPANRLTADEALSHNWFQDVWARSTWKPWTDERLSAIRARPALSKRSNRLDAPSASCVSRPWKDYTTPIGTWRLSIGTAQNERCCIGHQWMDIDCAAEERLLREADTSTMDEKGQTLLHLAVDIDSPQMVALSLNRGAVVSLQDQGGKTALHVAAKRGSQKTENYKSTRELKCPGGRTRPYATTSFRSSGIQESYKALGRWTGIGLGGRRCRLHNTWFGRRGGLRMRYEGTILDGEASTGYVLNGRLKLL